MEGSSTLPGRASFLRAQYDRLFTAKAPTWNGSKPFPQLNNHFITLARTINMIRPPTMVERVGHFDAVKYWFAPHRILTCKIALFFFASYRFGKSILDTVEQFLGKHVARLVCAFAIGISVVEVIEAYCYMVRMSFVRNPRKKNWGTPQKPMWKHPKLREEK